MVKYSSSSRNPFLFLSWPSPSVSNKASEASNGSRSNSISHQSGKPSLSLSFVGKFESEDADSVSICCEDLNDTKGENGKAASNIMTTARTT